MSLKAYVIFWVYLLSFFKIINVIHAHCMRYNAQTYKNKVTCDSTLQKYNHLNKLGHNLIAFTAFMCIYSKKLYFIVID